MARQIRLDSAGYYHIVNRGVARSNIYQNGTDKEKFLEIVCKACKMYKANVHDYCLMDNHYHLLIQTTEDNLSLLMHQISSNYAIYFNRKYGRVGHLWQGRFKSWFVFKEEYLYLLIRYIENNPLKANLSKRVGEYPFTLASNLINHIPVIPCAESSLMIKEFDTESLEGVLEIELTDEERKLLDTEQKRKITEDDNGDISISRSRTLEEHFQDSCGKQARDAAVYNAYLDGYPQSEIAKQIGKSASLVSKIVKGFHG